MYISKGGGRRGNLRERGGGNFSIIEKRKGSQGRMVLKNFCLSRGGGATSGRRKEPSPQRRAFVEKVHLAKMGVDGKGV